MSTLTFTHTGELTPAGHALVRLAHDLLDAEGGCTLSFRGEETPTHGFMVGGFAEERITRTPTWEGIAEYAQSNSMNLDRAHVYLGLWRDSETERVHMDVSDWWPTLTEAMDIARGRGEIAIWNVGQSREIRL